MPRLWGETVLQAEISVPDVVARVGQGTTRQLGSVDVVGQAAGGRGSEGLDEVSSSAQPNWLQGTSGAIWFRTFALHLVAQPSSPFPLPLFPLGVAVSNSPSGAGLSPALLFSSRTEHARA